MISLKIVISYLIATGILCDLQNVKLDDIFYLDMYVAYSLASMHTNVTTTNLKAS